MSRACEEYAPRGRNCAQASDFDSCCSTPRHRAELPALVPQRRWATSSHEAVDVFIRPFLARPGRPACGNDRLAVTTERVIRQTPRSYSMDCEGHCMKTRELLLLHDPLTNRGKAYLNHLQVLNPTIVRLGAVTRQRLTKRPATVASGKPSRWPSPVMAISGVSLLSAPRIKGFCTYRIREGSSATSIGWLAGASTGGGAD